MARKKVIVKRLNAIQNFGAMDVLCTDKTGTLTQGKIVLESTLMCMVIPAKRFCILIPEQLSPYRVEKSLDQRSSIMRSWKNI